MEINLYMLSAYEEYANKHMCRGHWNYEWRGRRGTYLDGDNIVKLRKEEFGGLFQSADGKIYKIDNQGYEFIKQYLGGFSIKEICKRMQISDINGQNFVDKLTNIGV